jgi:hypothetical protein
MTPLARIKKIWKLTIELRDTRVMLRYFTDPRIIADIKLNMADIRSQIKDLLR